MGIKQTVARNSVIMMGGTVLVAAISIFITGFIARKLGVEEYGIFTFGVTFSALCLPFTNLGLRAISVRDIARNRGVAATYLGRIVTIRIMIYLIVIMIVFAAFKCLQYEEKMVRVAYLFAMGLFFDVISTSYRDLFQAFEKMQYIAYIDIFLRLFSAVTAVIVLMMDYGLYAVVLTYIGASGFAVAVSLYYAYRYGINIVLGFNWKFTIKSIKEALPFGLTTIVKILFLRIDIAMLSKMVNGTTLGLYSAPANFLNRLNFIPGVLATASFPAIARAYKQNQADLEQVLRSLITFSFIISVPFTISIVFGSKAIILVIFGDQYLSSVKILHILAMIIPFNFFNNIVDSSFQAMDRQHLIFALNAVNLILVVVLNLIFIPLYGAMGACLALLSVHSVYSLSLAVCLYRYVKFPIERRKLANIFLSAAIMAYICKPTDFLNAFYLIPVGLIVYFFLLFLTKTLTLREFSGMRKLMKR